MKKLKNETGRSMVEMLGVLAIIGVLSVGGIAGYNTAVTRMQVNKALNVANLFVLSVDEMSAKGDMETPYDTYDKNKLTTFFCSYFGDGCTVKQETFDVYDFEPRSEPLGTYEGTKFFVSRVVGDNINGPAISFFVVGNARLCRPFFEGVNAAFGDKLYDERSFVNYMNDVYTRAKLPNLLKQCDYMVKRGFSGAFGFYLPWTPLENTSAGD